MIHAGPIGAHLGFELAHQNSCCILLVTERHKANQDGRGKEIDSLSLYGKRDTFTLQRAWIKGGGLFGGVATCSKYNWITLSHYRLNIYTYVNKLTFLIK